jgi:hypothetical protein
LGRLERKVRGGHGHDGTPCKRAWHAALCLLCLGCGGSGSGPVDPPVCPVLAGPPYPQSDAISGATWDFAGLVRLAPGSDLWPTTWGSDDQVYTSWGDGGGFGGTDADGRVSLGFGRIRGSPPNPEGENVWGGKGAAHPATFEGKATGIVSIGGVLYAWVNMQNGEPPDTRLAWSGDAGATWTLADWRFQGRPGGFDPLTFLNFARDNAGARDDFVYAYGKRWSGGDDPFAGRNSYLARARGDRLREEGAYEFFVGLDEDCGTIWSADIRSARAVISDPAGIDAPNVVWNPGLGRFVATTARSQQVQRLLVLDAPEPWGPWTTIAGYDDWGGFGPSESLGYSIPTKWISADGLTLWVVFSASVTLDSFNLVRGTLERAAR